MKQKKKRLTAAGAAGILTAAFLPVFPSVHAAGTTLTVGKNGDYKTVSAALQAAAALNPTSESSRVTVAIEPGTYREQLLINTPYLTFINSNPSGGDVTLTWYYGIGYQYYSAASSGYYNENDARAKSAKGKAQRWGTATRLQSGAKYFRAENIHFENSFNLYVTDEELADGVEVTGESQTTVRYKGLDVTAKSTTERAAAMCVEADFCEFCHCNFTSSQDTLYTANPAYFKECKIQGNTDYIFGSGDVVFDTCELCFGGYSDNAAGGYITAARAQTNGYLFWNCNVTANPGKKVGAGFFGRPWKDTAHVLFYNTTLPYEGIIQGAGWTSMSGVDPAAATFREYHTTVNGNPVNTGSRVRGTVLNSCNATREQYFGSWTPYYLSGKIVETGAKMDTTQQFYIRNLKNGLYLAHTGENAYLTGREEACAWQFVEAGDGYYYIENDMGAEQRFLVTDADNIGVTGEKQSAEPVKAVGSSAGMEFLLRSAEDKHCLASGGGENVVQTERSGDQEQHWELVPKLTPLTGKYIKELYVYDRSHASAWSIAENAKNGDLVFGDRDVTLLNLPAELSDAEYIRTSCDSKNYKDNLAELTAANAVTVYAAMDTRVDPLPAWLSGWTQTALTFDNTGEVHFLCYAKTLAAGESVVLGANGQSSYCVNYAVFVKPMPQQTTSETTVTTTTETTTETTVNETTVTESSAETAETAVSATLAGDVNCDGKVTVSDAILLARIVAEDTAAKVSETGMLNAELDGVTGLSSDDTIRLLKQIAGLN
ncbi:MAG: hypothetical protein IK130_07445 [Oscillospiraceae bacterium]|nr:hypothetical protein [Oscillospiraceae bacterium]